MIAVIFEVWPSTTGEAAYLELAASLTKQLASHDGLISIERFRSLTEEGKLLSLSIWRDEAAVRGWRTNLAHRSAQAHGRAGLFRDYRLRVASIQRDYGLTNRTEVPDDG
ncbi:MAG: antibiotic biosynthesis monooxygenase [Alphaproteobacteria bacterium]|nr:MAG: antibiotic biosynthesis monooxygenase [Alphaproteobacteria bacterium]